MIIVVFALALLALRLFYSLAEVCFERDFPRNTWRGLILAGALVLLSLSAFGQNVYYGTIANTTTGTGQMVPMLALPGAYVNFYTGCTVLPCSTPAATFTSASGSACASNAQVVWQPPVGSGCQATADSQGNFGAWLAAGAYQYTLTISGHTTGPYNFNVGGGGSGGTTIVEVNGTAASPVSPVNFVNSDSVTFDLSGSTISATAAASGLQLGYTQQGTGQYVLVPFTSAACTANGSGTSYNTPGTLNPLTLGDGGFSISGGQVGSCTFSAPALPAGVTAGQITAVYAIGWKSQSDYGNANPSETTHLAFAGTGITGGCSPQRNSTVGGMVPTPLQYGCQVTGYTGNFANITATSTGATNPFEGGGSLNYIAALEVDYTGTPVVQPAPINLGPGFGWNQTTNTLSLLDFALYPLSISSLEGIPEQPANTYNLVLDGSSTTDCSVGGGSNAVWCIATWWSVPEQVWRHQAAEQFSRLPCRAAHSDHFLIRVLQTHLLLLPAPPPTDMSLFPLGVRPARQLRPPPPI
jgi:hypothetical protein